MKIVGYTVGTPLPKPNFDQTDPRKGDFIKGDRSFITPDDTLTESGRPADAKATGDAINNLQASIDQVSDSVSEQIEAAIANKADAEHAHDDRYYTEQEIDSKIGDINTSILNIASDYETKIDAQTKFDNAKTYTDDAVSQKSQVQIITSDVSELLSTLKIHKLTQEEYEQKITDGTLEDNAIYLTPDEEIDFDMYATKEELNDKADKLHAHKIDDVDNLQLSLDQLLIESKAYTDDVMNEHNHDDEYYTEAEVDSKLDTMLANANEYTDDKIALLMNNSSTAVDSIMELAAAMEENEDVVAAINEAVGKKADVEHTHDDLYYTENEIDTKFNVVDASISNIISNYETKEDATEKLNAAKTYADGVKPTAILETNSGLEQKFWRGTQAEYNTIATKDDNTMYIIVDDEGHVVQDSIVNSINGKTGDVLLTASDVGAPTTAQMNSALADVKQYADNQILKIPTPDVSGQIGTHNTDTSAHADIRNAVSQKSQVQIITWGADD